MTPPRVPPHLYIIEGAQIYSVAFDVILPLFPQGHPIAATGNGTMMWDISTAEVPSVGNMYLQCFLSEANSRSEQQATNNWNQIDDALALDHQILSDHLHRIYFAWKGAHALKSTIMEEDLTNCLRKWFTVNPDGYGICRNRPPERIKIFRILADHFLKNGVDFPTMAYMYLANAPKLHKHARRLWKARQKMQKECASEIFRHINPWLREPTGWLHSFTCTNKLPELRGFANAEMHPLGLSRAFLQFECRRCLKCTVLFYVTSWKIKVLQEQFWHKFVQQGKQYEDHYKREKALTTAT